MFLLSPDYWEVKTTRYKGRGIFATKDIPAGTILGDYLGRVIAAGEEHRYEEGGNFYTMYLSDTASIFPNPQEVGIHFINHSCTPTCWMYIYQGHTLYFALRKIFAGEEITVDYLMDPLDDTCAPCTDKCRCEELLCRTLMHVSPKLAKAWGNFSEPQRSHAVYTIGQPLPPLSSYPKTIPDMPLYTLMGNTQQAPAVLDLAALPSLEELRTTIRHTGRTLVLPKVHMTILGVVDSLLISKPL